MEVLFHLVFVLFKIALLASIYAAVLVGIVSLLGKMRPDGNFGERRKKKMKTWWGYGFIISVGLFFYFFSYWGNHGLGDSALVPVGYFKKMEAIDFDNSFFYTKSYQNGSSISVKQFEKSGRYVVGETQVNPVDRPPKYFCWDLLMDEVEFFETEEEYHAFAKKENLPKTSAFREFPEHYSERWHSWRFWLLP